MKIKSNKIRYLSLFSGIGGFELGIQQANEHLQNISDPKEQQYEAKDSDDSQRWVDVDWKKRLGNPICIGYSEIDKYAIQVYQKHFPNHKNNGDITKINPSELPDFDFLCGGFPCQAFSIAGKRRGFEDTRGTLFFEIVRILRVKQPRILLLENVKGLLSHDNGNTFKTIITTLDELGYDLQWQVLNSKNFGVPQNRERVFIVGHLRGTARPQVFPIGDYNGKNNEQDKLHDRCKLLEGNELRTIQKEKETTVSKPSGQIIRKEWDKSNNPDSRRREAHTTYRVRRLTPTECMRLQGFPDDWCDGISDTQRYKCCGNAVTTNVIQAIMEKLL